MELYSNKTPTKAVTGTAAHRNYCDRSLNSVLILISDIGKARCSSSTCNIILFVCCCWFRRRATTTTTTTTPLKVPPNHPYSSFR